MQKSDVRVGDICAGIGGFSLAAHWVGWSTEFFVEWEEYPQLVLKKNFPGVRVEGDLTKYNGTYHEADILTGGIPCQPFSTAGNGFGEDDPRHLFPSFKRAVRAIKPAVAIIENVRGLLSNNNGVVFEKVCAEMEGEGYAVQSFLFPACAFGAPHRRDRIWIVAYSTRSDDWRHIRESYLGQAQQSGDCVESGIAANADRSQAGPSGEGQQHDRGLGGEAVDNREEASLQKDGEADSDDHSGHAVDASNAYSPERGKVGSTLRYAESNGCLPRGEEGSGGLESGNQESTSIAGDASHTNGLRHEGQGRDEGQLCSTKGGTEEAGESVNEIEGRQHGSTDFGGAPVGGESWQESWPQVAARLCRVDAGLPDILDSRDRKKIHQAVAHFGREEVERITGLDLRKVEERVHRTARLKALGNTIVPHPAYCILDAIDRHILQSLEEGVWPPEVNL